MKKSETIIRTLKLEDVRFRFKQLRKDLFLDDMYRLEEMISQTNIRDIRRWFTSTSISEASIHFHTYNSETERVIKHIY